MVSPRRGRPREPGGSRPFTLGWFHLYTHRTEATTMAKATTHTARDSVSMAFKISQTNSAFYKNMVRLGYPSKEKKISQRR
jgi:hypothetical protein